MKRFAAPLLWGFFSAVVTIAVSGCAGSQQGFEVPPALGDALSSSRAAIAQGDYQRAVLKLNSFLQESPGSALLDEANFLLGRANLGLKDRVLAADYFQRVLRDFEGSPFCPDAAWYLAQSYDQLSKGPQLDQDWTERALSAYGSFLVQYPDHARVPDARERIRALDDRIALKALQAAELYERLRAWESARIYYQKVIDEHPSSRLLCRARVGLGSSYVRLFHFDEAVEVLEACQPDCPEPHDQGRITELLQRARDGQAHTPAPRAAAPTDTTGSRPDSASGD